MRDSGIARLLRRTGFAGSISKKFEFGLALLDGSGVRTGSGSDRVNRVSGVPANPAQHDATPKGVPVMLFKGCVTEGLFKRVNDATSRVLKVNSCGVRAPDAQVCCGALHAHAGDLEGARKLARQNIDAFNESEASVVTNAGGLRRDVGIVWSSARR
jgi:Fe-S oxidoreductase